MDGIRWLLISVKSFVTALSLSVHVSLSLLAQIIHVCSLTSSPPLYCVRAVRVDPPVPLPLSTPADSTTRADTRPFPHSCSHPVTLCLINSAVMWACVLLCVCVCECERQISLLQPHWGSVEIANGCTMVAFNPDVHTYTHKNKTWDTCRSITYT